MADAVKPLVRTVLATASRGAVSSAAASSGPSAVASTLNATGSCAMSKATQGAGASFATSAGPVARRGSRGAPVDATMASMVVDIRSLTGVAPMPIPVPVELLGGHLPLPAAVPTTAGSSSAAAAAAAASATSPTVRAMSPLRSTRAPTAVSAAAALAREESKMSGTTSVGIAGAMPHTVESSAHVVPRYARREFADMFLDAPKTAVADMKLVTFAYKTKADMATWSSDILEEREQLLEEFHSQAKSIVAQLQAVGSWADYVDPISGEAQLSRSKSVFLETDDRMRLFGFDVVDFGCCKALSHAQWGTHVFVGCVFTDAPMEVVKKLMAQTA